MLTQSEIDAIKQEAEKICEFHCIFSDGQLISIVEKVLTSERQRAKVLLDEFVKLIKEANVTGVAIPISKVDEILNTYNKNKPNDRE